MKLLWYSLVSFLILYSFTIPVFADLCSSTTTISAGTTHGNTDSSSDNNSDNCGGDSAPEKIYVYTIASTKNVVISTDNSGTDFDTLLYVRTDCLGDTLGCNDDIDGGNTNSRITLNNLNPGTYFIFVDGSFTFPNSGNFTLTITESDPVSVNDWKDYEKEMTLEMIKDNSKLVLHER